MSGSGLGLGLALEPRGVFAPGFPLGIVGQRRQLV
jgi:hypothetical protein